MTRGPGRLHRLPGDAALVRRTAVRLGLQAAASTLVVVALIAAVAVVMLARSIQVDDEHTLSVTAMQADDTVDPPPGTWIVLRTAAGTVWSRGLPSGLPLTDALDRVDRGGPAEVTAVTVAGHDYRVLTRIRPGTPRAVVQVVLDAAPGEARLAALLRSLGLAGLVALVLAAAAGVWLGRRAVAPLQAALALQHRFVADASHELRTPVTLLSTRAQLLRRRVCGSVGGDGAADLQEEMDGLVADAGRLASILDDLLLAADPRPMGPGVAADVDVVAVARSVIEGARPAASTAGVALGLDAPEDAHASGSEAGLLRAVTDVLDNAVRYARSRVDVTVTTSGRQVVVDISDDGPGIDEALLPRLFQRFTTDGPARSADGGTRRYGIGLALVAEILNRCGGTITARNDRGGGATFRLVLPLARPARP